MSAPPTRIINIDNFIFPQPCHNTIINITQCNTRYNIKNANKSTKSYVLQTNLIYKTLSSNLIQIISSEIDEIEFEIKRIMNDINSPILSIPGISYHMGAMIIAEIGDFSNFSSPNKILAYSGMSPSTYQSGHLTNCYAHMEKRGSRYLRYALYNATQHVCRWDKTFADYLAKKRSEGKHYNVAISHATKKLLRVLYHLEKTGELYQIA